ncbi:MAG: hypothetical protein L0Y44_07940 [Phycisphaerales bacterium]|nr:hypothetical protein [Phycisphaerales bacterium]MCI0630565.1 hypothetical protein [Phycisphaerales bacterium]MCI0675998.1 hypothetical protein [Phycisphaerales bacterium]
MYLNVDESADEELAKAETEVEVPDPLAAVEGAFTIRNVVFPKAGEYRLALESNGVPLLERRLVVTGPRSSTA